MLRPLGASVWAAFPPTDYLAGKPFKLWRQSIFDPQGWIPLSVFLRSLRMNDKENVSGASTMRTTFRKNPTSTSKTKGNFFFWNFLIQEGYDEYLRLSLQLKRQRTLFHGCFGGGWCWASRCPIPNRCAAWKIPKIFQKKRDRLLLSFYQKKKSINITLPLHDWADHKGCRPWVFKSKKPK